VRTLAVETSWEGDDASVVLTGELDLSTAPEVEQALAEAEEKQPARMVIDLRQLAFMDSTGLRVVLAADGRARRDGRRLEVVPGPPQVHRVFRIALLDKRIAFVDAPDGSGESPS
jgi:anti-anti-sigma factor